MRVTNNLIYGQSSQAITSANDRLLTIQDKINKQTNITKASDDPVGARAVLQYQVSNEKLAQYDEAMKMATSNLEYQEVALDSLNGFLDEAKTLFIQAQNDVNTQTDVDAITQQLSMIVESMAELMNSKSADGSYIFAGTDTKSPAFVIGSDGRYQWVGNEGQKHVQIAENMQMAVTNSGKHLFQDIWTHHNFNARVKGGDVELIAKVRNQGSFNKFIDKYYNPVDSEANKFVLTTRKPGADGTGSRSSETNTAEALDVSPQDDKENSDDYYGLPGEYVVTNYKGEEIAAGPYVAGRPILFGGMTFTLKAAPGEKVDISLIAPKRDNVLNQINDSIRALSDKEASIDEREEAIFNATTSINNTQRVVGEGRSSIGARLNTLANREDFSAANHLSNAVTQEKIGGLDVAAAASELSMAESALTASQKLFSRINNLSLFNQI
ncbi:flagellar hook-associated protein FlgL [Marinomonas transparens]|uniref:Flagellar hook-associated protein FlgL n=1 Tax=Marinomonas transparens TaxID=2795388 RepID=A0A934JTR0_9GAMM|nr:flagellar hook-associated protein FlgL [Marinomonas transparens]MBJ7539804.1 flagellar hook-associated protein FlgL [Marinomonas transparens]